MKVAIVIPTRDCRIHYASAMAHSFLIPTAPPELQAEVGFFVVPGQSNIPRARNQGAAQALHWGAKKIWFIDDDISHAYQDFWRITARPELFIAGLPQRRPADISQLLQKPMILGSFKDSNPVVGPNGLCEALRVPTAYLCLDREVFKKRRVEKTETYEPAHKFELPQLADEVNEFCYGYFSYSSHSDFEFANGHMYGEDYFISNWWREAGGKVWVDPDVRLGHHSELFNFNLSLRDILNAREENPDQVAPAKPRKRVKAERKAA